MATSTAHPPRRQPEHMPRLSYRNTPQDDEPDTWTRSSSRHDGPNAAHAAHAASAAADANLPSLTAAVPASTARKPRPRSARPSSANAAAAGTRTSVAGTASDAHAPPKKRGSLFSGLFVKEPSSVALEQLAQKLISEHGELSAKAIPGVSCATMPKTVPKVNSKWDGRPGATRPKGGRGPEARGTTATSSGSSARSRSAEPSERAYASSRGNQTEPWEFSSASSVDRTATASQSSTPRTPTSLDTFAFGTRGSVGASALSKPPRPYSASSRSLRSPSGSSLPPITSFFPDEIPDPPRLPATFRPHRHAQATLPAHSKPAGLSKPRPPILITPEPPGDRGGDRRASQSGTSSAASPATPLSNYTPRWNVDHAPPEEDGPGPTPLGQSKPEEVVLQSSGKNVLGPPVGASRKVRPLAKAFPAGEACPLEIPGDDTPHPPSGREPDGLAGSPAPVLSKIARVNQDLEKRPDSSRARLGLRASMLVDDNAGPVLASLSRTQQDLERRPDSSRARLGLRASMLVDPDTLLWPSPENGIDRSSGVRGAPTSGTRMATSPKFKPKGLGLFAREKTEK